jgi:hypothetical protein
LKVVKGILFSFACLVVFLVAGAATCAIRAKYKYTPMVKSSMAHSYVSLVGEYSFLQYNQAGGEKGKTALLDYHGVLQKIQNEGIQDPQRTLHFYSGFTYMRLYRLDLAANKPAEATDYLKSAQREFSSLGWKDDVVSPENLIKKAEMREASEAKLYNLEKNLNAPAAREGP